MRIDVQLFAGARAQAGRETITLDLPGPVRTSDVKAALAASVPELEVLLPSLRIAVNLELAPDDALIPPDAEVAAIPPVSGGAAASSTPTPTRA